MGVFYKDEPPNPSRRCKFISETLRGAFSSCRDCGGRQLSSSSQLDDCSTSKLEEEHDEIVSAIRSRAIEKLKQKPFLVTESFSCVSLPMTGEMFVTSKGVNHEETRDDDGEEFVSVRSCLSCCSSALSKEACFSVKTNLSWSSSLNGLEFPDLWRRLSIFQELCHCEGWPFGLCRKAVLLPPLPKSPSESWSWRKGNRVALTFSRFFPEE